MHTNEVIKLAKVDWTWVGLGPTVGEVKMSPNFANDEFLEVDFLMYPVGWHSDVFDAGGD